MHSLDWDNIDDLSYLGLSREYRTQIKLLCKLGDNRKEFKNFKVIPELAEGEITVGYIKKGSNHNGERILAMPFRDQSWDWSYKIFIAIQK